VTPVRSIEWVGGPEGFVRLLDQTLLPTEVRYRDCGMLADVREAICTLRIRGAPAIGIAAAMGLVLYARELQDKQGRCSQASFDSGAEWLAAARPTAVNLRWAIHRMKSKFASAAAAGQRDPVPWLLDEAIAIREEDARMCRSIGRFGADLFANGDGILTHCNAGGLATAEYGTALAALFCAAEQGKQLHVFVDETRPLLQGSRLTAWELQRAGIDVTVICDNMAALAMKERRVHSIIVGADRIAANGDTANKIGTYGVAVLARAHEIPFYVAAPSSTFDLDLPDGSGIPIEQRDPREVSRGFGKETVPEGVSVYNPAFDVTPAALVSAIVTERGIIRPVDARAIRTVLQTGSAGKDA
jgi:methylthioribose-1-phosphate isomerase